MTPSWEQITHDVHEALGEQQRVIVFVREIDEGARRFLAAIAHHYAPHVEVLRADKVGLTTGGSLTLYSTRATLALLHREQADRVLWATEPHDPIGATRRYITAMLTKRPVRRA